MILILKNDFRMLKRPFRNPKGFHYTVGMYGQTLNIKNLKQMPNVILMAQHNGYDHGIVLSSYSEDFRKKT